MIWCVHDVCVTLEFIAIDSSSNGTRNQSENDSCQLDSQVPVLPKTDGARLSADTVLTTKFDMIFLT